MDTSKFKTDIFNLFDKKWAIVTAGKRDDFNSMTIAWGTMGTIWGGAEKGKPILTVFVNPLRYTYEFMNKNDLFTVCFFSEKFRKELLLMGSRSGREGDRLKGTGLTPVFSDNCVYFKEAETAFVCRKLYQQTLDKSLIPPEIAAKYYKPNDDAHRMYIGEVLKIIEKA